METMRKITNYICETCCLKIIKWICHDQYDGSVFKEKTMEKIERDGMVAVLVSHGFGAGWSTWNSEYRETLCMDSEIVQAVLDGDKAKAVKIAKQKCCDFYDGGIEGLTVEWVKKGAEFEIYECDGSESLHIIGDHDYMVA